MSAEEPLHLGIVDGVAIVELDNPPVNALYDSIREGIVDLMPRLDRDPAVAVILFVGAGRAFSAGVDLKRTAAHPEPFFFHAALDAIDQVAKPVAAAIHGAALGGGLELALACHYRLAGPSAKFGLPEVNVGIIPGACGTQRLPRLIALDAALGVAALGDTLDAEAAKAAGLVDAVADDADFRAAALRWAGTLRGAAVRRTRDLPVRIASDAEATFAAAETRAAAERPSETAPSKAIEAVRAACELPFDQGVEVERRLVTERKQSDEARRMRELFFARNATAKAEREKARG